MTAPHSDIGGHVGLQVELVSVEREVWSGEADMVVARTTEGEIGILPGHAPLLGQLAEGHDVRIQRTSGGELAVAVSGGFLSVTDAGVTILAEAATLPGESVPA
jgi:F-type H+-transporting ATPase subunit epsilon